MDGIDTEDYSLARCDDKGCGWQAQVAAHVIVALPSGGTLAYCTHHANKYRRALEEQGALIVELTPA